MSKMKRFMAAASAISLVLMFIFFIMMKMTDRPVFMTYGLIFMTLSIHFISRTALGNLVGGIPLAHIDPNRKRFRERKFERKLYKLLRVKKWKKRFPVYDKKLYSLEEHTPEELLRIVCRSEMVHWYSADASLLTVLLALPFETVPIFLIGAILGILLDLAFVAVLRYNRPRIEQTVVQRSIKAAKAENAAENIKEE